MRQENKLAEKIKDRTNAPDVLIMITQGVFPESHRADGLIPKDALLVLLRNETTYDELPPDDDDNEEDEK